MERLAAGPAAVGELAAHLPVSRPAVSQHLRVLEGCGLVAHDADGTRHVYRVAPDGLLALRGWLDEYWATALQSFADHAENTSRSQP